MTTASSPGPSAGTGTERPTTVAEAADLLRGSRGSVLFRGGGTKMTWGGRPAEPQLVVETGGLRRLLGHNPADMTASVEAGMPLETLQGVLADAGQWLALDPPTESAGATIGGLLATGDSGPRRLRYGALRDLAIGVTLVLPDGTIARAGGQVIKNVAGYDLTKMMYGSLGILGLVAEVVLRVHPKPEASATMVAPASVAAAGSATLRLLASPLEPAAVDWAGQDGDGAGTGTGRLAVRFEGSAAGVAAQRAAVQDLLAADGLAAEEVAEAAESELWRDVAAARTAGPGQSVAFAGTLPSSLTTVADGLASACRAAGAAATLTSHTALGLHSARFSGPAEGQARAFHQWRDAVAALGGTVLLRDRPPEVDAAADPLGPPPPTAALLRAVKSRLDPDGRCAPGRLGSWLAGEDS